MTLETTGEPGDRPQPPLEQRSDGASDQADPDERSRIERPAGSLTGHPDEGEAMASDDPATEAGS